MLLLLGGDHVNRLGLPHGHRISLGGATLVWEWAEPASGRWEVSREWSPLPDMFVGAGPRGSAAETSLHLWPPFAASTTIWLSVWVFSRWRGRPRFARIPLSRTHRIARVAALAACIAVGAIGFASCFLSIRFQNSALSIESSLSGGAIGFRYHAPGERGLRIDDPGVHARVWVGASVGAHFHFQSTGNWGLGLPLWIPFDVLVFIAARLWWPRPRPGERDCVSCGYDLTGNVSGRCPECGGDAAFDARSVAVQRERRLRPVTRLVGLLAALNSVILLVSFPNAFVYTWERADDPPLREPIGFAWIRDGDVAWGTSSPYFFSFQRLGLTTWLIDNGQVRSSSTVWPGEVRDVPWIGARSFVLPLWIPLLSLGTLFFWLRHHDRRRLERHAEASMGEGVRE